MSPYIQPSEFLQAQPALSGIIRRNKGSWSKLLQAVPRRASSGIDGLEVTESTFEEWMAVEQQFEAQVERRWF